MMVIYGQSLAIMTKRILIMLPFIHAIPSKKLIHFDISGPPHSRMVETIPSEAYPGGIHYTMKAACVSKYILGTVRDGQEVIMDGDQTAMNRYVLVQNRQDGMRYIRVITRWRIRGNSYRSHIDEFVKRVGDAHYRPITRVHIEVDLLTQDVDQYIHVELIVDWEEHERNVAIGRTNGGFPEDLDTLPMRFTVQDHAMDEVTIGVVKFGDHLLEYLVDGLMTREVIWEGGLDAPIITITSRYKNGKGTETKHKFVGGEKGFILYKIKSKIPQLCD